ncbi:MAG: hypothetical protein HYT87_07800 [Nitrospirae bacterium]|nr:hypothetical protein [Nitrospirota bacterium]
MKKVPGGKFLVPGRNKKETLSPQPGTRNPEPGTFSGFTLLELVLVIVLAIALSGVLGLIVSQGIRGGLAQAERRDMVKEGMEALEKMTRDIRMLSDSDNTLPVPAGCATSAPETDVLCAKDDQFEFRSNLPDTPRVCYRKNGTTLERGTAAAVGAVACDACTSWEALARNVVNSDLFEYYRYNGTQIPDGALAAADMCFIWRVQIELQLRRGTSTTDPLRNVTLRTSVFPRDLAER